MSSTPMSDALYQHINERGWNLGAGRRMGDAVQLQPQAAFGRGAACSPDRSTPESAAAAHHALQLMGFTGADIEASQHQASELNARYAADTAQLAAQSHAGEAGVAAAASSSPVAAGASASSLSAAGASSALLSAAPASAAPTSSSPTTLLFFSTHVLQLVFGVLFWMQGNATFALSIFHDASPTLRPSSFKLAAARGFVWIVILIFGGPICWIIIIIVILFRMVAATHPQATRAGSAHVNVGMLAARAGFLSRGNTGGYMSLISQGARLFPNLMPEQQATGVASRNGEWRARRAQLAAFGPLGLPCCCVPPTHPPLLSAHSFASLRSAAAIGSEYCCHLCTPQRGPPCQSWALGSGTERLPRLGHLSRPSLQPLFAPTPRPTLPTFHSPSSRFAVERRQMVHASGDLAGIRGLAVVEEPAEVGGWEAELDVLEAAEAAAAAARR